MQGFLTITVATLVNACIFGGMVLSQLPEDKPYGSPYGLIACGLTNEFPRVAESFRVVDRLGLFNLPTLDKFLGLEIVKAGNQRGG